MTVKELKNKVNSLTGVPIADMNFLYMAKRLLDEDKSLADYNVLKGSTITCLRQQTGG